MGQSSVRAALIYQHSSLKRQREIADDMDARVRKQRKERPESKDHGQTGGGAASA